MFRFIFCLLLSLIGYSVCQEVALKGKLIFAQIIFRHGDRTPVDPYPTDPYKDLKYWPTGWGQLTNIGKQQHYHLGTWLRQRYEYIINDTYSSESIYARSTDVDRTLMSALSNLAGLFPPSGNQIWNEDLAWQPIPVHTVPEKQDSILAAKKPCPAYNYALSKLKQSEEFRKLRKRFSYLFKYLSTYTGRIINNLEGVQIINNTLFIEELYNKTLPEWTDKVYPGGDMKFISDLTFATSTFTRKLARLKSGPLLKEILERFKDKAILKLKPNRVLWIYSGHDTTVANLLNTLKLFDYHSPPYTACILLELRIDNQLPFVSVFYKNSSSDPDPLYIPNCGTLCPLDRMFDLYKDVLPDDWESECKLSMLSLTYEEADVGYATAILMGITTFIFLMISTYLAIIYCRRRSYLDYRRYVQI